MEFKLNLVIKLNANSEHDARHRRDTIHEAIKLCSGLEDIEESLLVTMIPEFKKQPKYKSMNNCIYQFTSGCSLDKTGLMNCDGDYNKCPYKGKNEVKNER